ncbi:unnamed protein product [Cladocopium goreaui]|uniref:Uncharacterized protein n=1 Tax=Cladocopium goreaui TaxID=2562237 RepID=A0A9P1D4N1_9DINO|nr:unnamed protein product [Cladocopium goreaui]
MGGGASKVSGPKLSNLLTGQSKADRVDFDRAFAKFPPTPSRTWGFQVKNEALYANDSWLSTQKRIRMSDINRLLGLRPYPGKPAGGKVRDLDIINMVWGNPQWIDPDEDQNYNLNFTRQQHHDMGPQGLVLSAVSTEVLADERHKLQSQRLRWTRFL